MATTAHNLINVNSQHIFMQQQQRHTLGKAASPVLLWPYFASIFANRPFTSLCARHSHSTNPRLSLTAFASALSVTRS
jgi:hypothetical protein